MKTYLRHQFRGLLLATSLLAGCKDDSSKQTHSDVGPEFSALTAQTGEEGRPLIAVGVEARTIASEVALKSIAPIGSSRTGNIPASARLVASEPTPDLRGEHHIIVTDDLSSGASLFNGVQHQTRDVIVSGKVVKISPGSSLSLKLNFADKDQVQNVRTLSIFAETVEIEGLLYLPQTAVHIIADSVILLNNAAAIKTTPLGFAINAGADKPDRSGENGQPGGAVALQINRLVLPDATSTEPRFIVDGGKGQKGGDGRNGADGTKLADRVFAGASAANLNAHMSAICDGSALPRGVDGAMWVRAADFNIFGTQEIPTNGTNAIPDGKPGDGGNAGNISHSSGATVVTMSGQQVASLESWLPGHFSAKGGDAGDIGTLRIGGLAGTPAEVIWMYYTYHIKHGRLQAAVKPTSSGKVETESGKPSMAQPSEAPPSKPTGQPDVSAEVNKPINENSKVRQPSGATTPPMGPSRPSEGPGAPDVRVWDAPRVEVVARPVPGTNASPPGPSKPVGSTGTVISVPNASTFHPSALRACIDTLRENYASGCYSHCEDEIQRYLAVVDSGRITTDQRFGNDVSQIRTELTQLKALADSGLDAWGNPRGFVPLLGLETNILAYKELSMKQAAGAMRSSLTVRHAVESVDAWSADKAKTITELHMAIKSAINGFNSINSEIGPLTKQRLELEAQIQVYSRILSAWESRIIEAAQRKVIDENRKKELLQKIKLISGILITASSYLAPEAAPFVLAAQHLTEGVQALSANDTALAINYAQSLQTDLESIHTVLKHLAEQSGGKPSPQSNVLLEKRELKTLKDWTELATTLYRAYAEYKQERRRLLSDAQQQVQAIVENLKQIQGWDELKQETDNLVIKLAAADAALSEHVQKAQALQSEITSKAAQLDQLSVWNPREAIDRHAMRRLAKSWESDAQVSMLYATNLLARSYEYVFCMPFALPIDSGRITDLKLVSSQIRDLLSSVASNVSADSVVEASLQKYQTVLDDIGRQVMHAFETGDVKKRWPRSCELRLTTSQIDRLNKTGRTSVFVERSPDYPVNGEFSVLTGFKVKALTTKGNPAGNRIHFSFAANRQRYQKARGEYFIFSFPGNPAVSAGWLPWMTEAIREGAAWKFSQNEAVIVQSQVLRALLGRNTQNEINLTGPAVIGGFDVILQDGAPTKYTIASLVLEATCAVEFSTVK